MMGDRPIILTGFMSSGKSTVARAIGHVLSCEVIDLDDAVSAEAGRTPKQIIETDGEAVFRDMETRVLASVLRSGSAPVIALGGGAWTINHIRQLIAHHGGITFWLDAPFELCWKRIPDGGGERPLAASEERARNLYDARKQLYASADVRIDVRQDRSVADIAQEIVRIASAWRTG